MKNVVIIIFFFSLILGSCIPKHDYDDKLVYRKFPNTLNHSIKELKLIRKQLFDISKQRIGEDSIYCNLFDTLNQRTNFWIKRGRYRATGYELNVFMDSLFLINRKKNIIVCIINNIIPISHSYIDRSKTEIRINDLGKPDTIIIKDSLKWPNKTDFYVSVYFKKINNKCKNYHEEINIVPKLGYMTIAHTPEQMKLLGIDYLFYGFLKVKGENTNSPKLLGYYEQAFIPVNNWYYKTFDD